MNQETTYTMSAKHIKVVQILGYCLTSFFTILCIISIIFQFSVQWIMFFSAFIFTGLVLIGVYALVKNSMKKYNLTISEKYIVYKVQQKTTTVNLSEVTGIYLKTINLTAPALDVMAFQYAKRKFSKKTLDKYAGMALYISIHNNEEDLLDIQFGGYWQHEENLLEQILQLEQKLNIIFDPKLKELLNSYINWYKKA